MLEGIDRIGSGPLQKSYLIREAVSEEARQEEEINTLALINFKNLETLELPSILNFIQNHKKIFYYTEEFAWTLAARWKYCLAMIEIYLAALEQLKIKISKGEVAGQSEVIYHQFQNDIYQFCAEEVYKFTQDANILKDKFLKVQQVYNKIVSPWVVSQTTATPDASLSVKIVHIFNIFVQREKENCQSIKDRIAEKIKEIEKLQASVDVVKKKIDVICLGSVPLDFEGDASNEEQGHLRMPHESTVKKDVIDQYRDKFQEVLSRSRQLSDKWNTGLLKMLEAVGHASRLLTLEKLTPAQTSKKKEIQYLIRDLSIESGTIEVNYEPLKKLIQWGNEIYLTKKRERQNKLIVQMGSAVPADIKREKELAKEVLFKTQITYSCLSKLEKEFIKVRTSMQEAAIRLNMPQPEDDFEANQAEGIHRSILKTFYLSTWFPSSPQIQKHQFNPAAKLCKIYFRQIFKPEASQLVLSDGTQLRLIEEVNKPSSGEVINRFVFGFNFVSKHRWLEPLTPPSRLLSLKNELAEGPVKAWVDFYENELNPLFEVLEDLYKKLHVPCLGLNAQYQKIKTITSASSKANQPFVKILEDKLVIELSLATNKLLQEKTTLTQKVASQKLIILQRIRDFTFTTKSNSSPDEKKVQEVTEQTILAVKKADETLRILSEQMEQLLKEDKAILDTVAVWTTEKEKWIKPEQDWVAGLEKEMHEEEEIDAKVQRGEIDLFDMSMDPSIVQKYSPLQTFLLSQNVIELDEKKLESQIYRHMKQMAVAFNAKELYSKWKEELETREKTNFFVIRKCAFIQIKQTKMLSAGYKKLINDLSLLEWAVDKAMALNYYEPISSVQREADWKLLTDRYAAVFDKNNYFISEFKLAEKRIQEMIAGYQAKAKKSETYQAMVRLHLRTSKGLINFERHIQEVLAFFETQRALLNHMHLKQLVPLSAQIVKKINALRDAQDGTTFSGYFRTNKKYIEDSMVTLKPSGSSLPGSPSLSHSSSFSLPPPSIAPSPSAVIEIKDDFLVLNGDKKP